MTLVRRTLPWLFAAVLLYFLFNRYPLEDVLAAATYVNVTALIIFLTVYFLYISLADSWSLKKILSRFHIDGPVIKILKLRLASNLAMILNYGIGQGVLAYLIKQQYHVPFARSSSVLIFQVLIDLYLALTISFIGSFFTSVVIDGLNLVPWIRLLWLTASLSFLSISLLIRYSSSLRRFKWQPVQDLFYTFHESGFHDYFKAMLWRIPLHLAASTYLYFLALCFGVYIPLEKVVTLLPLTVVVGAIPITPSGIGTVQITAIFLFQNFVTGDSISEGKVNEANIIFAMSIMFTIGIYILKLLSGTIFFRSAITIDPEQSSRR